MSNIQVRKAQRSDIPELRHIYYEFLGGRVAQDYTFLPTGRTIDFMFNTIFAPAIDNDNGMFVARDARPDLDGNLLGALFWVGEPRLPIQTRHRHVYGYGQWGAEWSIAGSTGNIIDAMIDTASAWAKAKGFTRVLDTAPCGHIKAHAAAARNGFRVTTDVLILDL